MEHKIMRSHICPWSYNYPRLKCWLVKQRIDLPCPMDNDALRGALTWYCTDPCSGGVSLDIISGSKLSHDDKQVDLIELGICFEDSDKIRAFWGRLDYEKPYRISMTRELCWDLIQGWEKYQDKIARERGIK